MNKLLKGAIAGAAGVALLLGGAGTFALWNDSANLDTGTITAGNLSVALDSTGVWADQNGDITDIGAYRIVPGDVLTYTQDVTVTADGDNLTAELGLADASVTATTPGNLADDTLAAYLNDPDNHSVTTADLAPATTPATYVVQSGTHAVTVVVTLTFPAGTLDDGSNDAKLGSVDLDNLLVTLNQTQPL
jgi:alternate signal-mediated exported protein